MNAASPPPQTQHYGAGRDIWLGLPILIVGYYLVSKFVSSETPWWESLIYVSLPLLALTVFASGFNASKRRSIVFGLGLLVVVLFLLIVTFLSAAWMFAGPEPFR